MIELNLLPDVKLEYIKAQRTRSLVISVAILVSVAAIVLLVLLLAYGGLQKKHIADLTKDVTAETTKLEGQKDIDKVLTVQGQLESLTSLHQGKPAASRITPYLYELTPDQIAISNLAVDFTAQTMVISGKADAISTVNRYIDTLKYTKYKSDTVTSSTSAFTSVVLASFGLTTDDAKTDKPANYTINVTYDKNIFDITQKVKLQVPNNLHTTRNGVSQDNALFQAPNTQTTTPKGTN